MTPFQKKWQKAVLQKRSLLCVGLDPAEPGQRSGATLAEGASKLEFCLHLIHQVAPYAAAIKINRNYIKDLSRIETKAIVSAVHAHGMVAIDDTKLVDIGETNDAGLYHAQQEGFDAVTYAPFPGNMAEAVSQAHHRGLGVIALVLMSNPEFQPIKSGTLGGEPAYRFWVKQAVAADADGVVIGAPSPHNHITEDEIAEVCAHLLPDQLVLVPGVGAQGGEARTMVSYFGSRVMINIGRALIYAADPALAAKQYCEMFCTHLSSCHPCESRDPL